jgi:hypothetical protein
VVGWANLRGLRESGRLFALPTYSFVLMVAVLAIAGAVNLLFSHGFQPDQPPAVVAAEPLGLFLILRAFSSGCSAMTGIEAIANGVQVFREPSAQRARRTLVVMGSLLAAMFLAVSGLGFMYGIAPHPDITVLAQIGQRLFGSGNPLYWFLQVTTLLILMLAANTAFADFPRLSALLARDNFLPRQMAWVGDRLVFQNGIVLLVLATAVIVLVSRGDTTVAVNLYALGVFLAFTISQAGMVVHGWRQRMSHWQGRVLMNGVGAICTLLVLLVIGISKFAEGAWTVVIAIPLLVLLLARIRQRYRQVYAAIQLPAGSRQPLSIPPRHEPIGNRSIVWLRMFSQPGLEALRYAATISDRVEVVWVLRGDDDPERIRADWSELVGSDPAINLTLLESPYASEINPFVDFVEAQESRHSGRLTIVMPMAIPRYWLDSLLLNQHGISLRRALDAHHNRVYTLVRYYLPA